MQAMEVFKNVTKDLNELLTYCRYLKAKSVGLKTLWRLRTKRKQRSCMM